MGFEHNPRHISKQGKFESKERRQQRYKKKEKKEKITAQPTNLYLFVCNHLMYKSADIIFYVLCQFYLSEYSISNHVDLITSIAIKAKKSSPSPRPSLNIFSGASTRERRPSAARSRQADEHSVCLQNQRCQQVYMSLFQKFVKKCQLYH